MLNDAKLSLSLFQDMTLFSFFSVRFDKTFFNLFVIFNYPKTIS